MILISFPPFWSTLFKTTESASSEPESDAFKIKLSVLGFGCPSGVTTFAATAFAAGFASFNSPTANSSPTFGNVSKPMMIAGADGSSLSTVFPKKFSKIFAFPVAECVFIGSPRFNVPFFMMTDASMPRCGSRLASKTKPDAGADGSNVIFSTSAVSKMRSNKSFMPSPVFAEIPW